MMNRKKIDILLFGLWILFFFSLAASFLLMPLNGTSQVGNISLYTLISGLMFWISIVMIIVIQRVLNYRRRRWYVINRIRKARSLRKNGLISFFQNIPAIIADIAMILSFIGLIVAMIATQGTGYICFVFISVFVFSFCMHCALNGKIYHHIINQDELLQLFKMQADACE